MRTYKLFQPGELRELHPEESTPAEKEGVEPSRLFTLVGFQDRCHRPLACLSIALVPLSSERCYSSLGHSAQESREVYQIRL